MKGGVDVGASLRNHATALLWGGVGVAAALVFALFLGIRSQKGKEKEIDRLLDMGVAGRLGVTGDTWSHEVDDQVDRLLNMTPAGREKAMKEVAGDSWSRGIDLTAEKAEYDRNPQAYRAAAHQDHLRTVAKLEEEEAKKAKKAQKQQKNRAPRSDCRCHRAEDRVRGARVGPQRAGGARHGSSGAHLCELQRCGTNRRASKGDRKDRRGGGEAAAGGEGGCPWVR